MFFKGSKNQALYHDILLLQKREGFEKPANKKNSLHPLKKMRPFRVRSGKVKD
jgi:hypothetical protein